VAIVRESRAGESSGELGQAELVYWEERMQEWGLDDPLTPGVHRQGLVCAEGQPR
jgi:hypothetical protein